MREHYVLKQAMDLLGPRSVNAFRHLATKYPDVFENINPAKTAWYDKAKLDEFAKTYKKQVKKHEHTDNPFKLSGDRRSDPARDEQPDE
jgi:hypothetical protein